MMKIWNDFIKLFYPDLCVVCEQPLVEGDEHICLRCLGKLLYRVSLNEAQINSLFAGKSGIIYAAAYLVFKRDTTVRRVIHDLKYHGNKRLAYYLGRMAFLKYQKLNDPICHVDVLLPVPLHPKRKEKRGYNQSEWIAKGISSVLHIPIDTTTLRRKVKTDTQTKKKVFGRWQNMENVFEVVDYYALQGKRVLLIDDVMTSGSTFNACAHELEAIQNIKLFAFALSMVPRN